MNKKYFSQRPKLKPTIYVYEIPDAVAKIAFEEGVEEAEKLIPIKTKYFLL